MTESLPSSYMPDSDEEDMQQLERKLEKSHNKALVKLIETYKKELPQLDIELTYDEEDYPDSNLSLDIEKGWLIDKFGREVFITPEKIMFVDSKKRKLRTIIYTLRGFNNWYSTGYHEFWDFTHDVMTVITLNPAYQSNKVEDIEENMNFKDMVKNTLPELKQSAVSILGDYPMTQCSKQWGWLIDHRGRLVVVTPERIIFERYENHNGLRQAARGTSNWSTVYGQTQSIIKIIRKFYQ